MPVFKNRTQNLSKVMVVFDSRAIVQTAVRQQLNCVVTVFIKQGSGHKFDLAVWMMQPDRFRRFWSNRGNDKRESSMKTKKKYGGCQLL